jgi:hypothetical protein
MQRLSSNCWSGATGPCCLVGHRSVGLCHHGIGGQTFETGLVSNIRRKSFMDKTRVICDGVTDGLLYIPPFTLNQGEAICLQAPYPVDDRFEQCLAQLLLGFRSVRGITTHGQAQWIDPFLRDPVCFGAAARWKMTWRNPRGALAWAQRNARLSHVDTEALLQKFGLKPSDRIDKLAATPRMVLGLECCRTNGTEIVVVSMAGLDPTGKKTVLETLNRMREKFAVVYISYHLHCQEKLVPDTIPGVPVILLSQQIVDEHRPASKEQVTRHAS